MVDIFVLLCNTLYKKWNKKTISYFGGIQIEAICFMLPNKSHWKETLYLWLEKQNIVTVTFCVFFSCFTYSIYLRIIFMKDRDNIKIPKYYLQLHIMNLFKSCILEWWEMHIFCIFMRLVDRFLLHWEVFFPWKHRLKK